MQILPIDLTAVVAVVLGMSLFLIPVIGMTARFALKPTVEALSRFFDVRGKDESIRILERRLALVEQQLDAVEGGLRRVEESVDFDARLRGTGEAPSSLPASAREGVERRDGEAVRQGVAPPSR